MAVFLYTLLQLTWGFPQTVIGLMMWLATAGNRRYRYRAANVTAWKLNKGLSLGPYLFVPDIQSEAAHKELLVHEYGHSIQSIIFGPLYLPFFVLPSLIWAGLPLLERRRHTKHISYYSLYTERLANWLGERVTHEKSPGQIVW